MKLHFKKVIAVLICIITVLNLCGCSLDSINSFLNSEPEQTDFTTDGMLTLRFLYVGQADCALITLPDGKNMLVDSGDDKDGKLIADYITSLGINSLDIVVATHPHADHIGGMDKILNRFTAGAIYAPVIPDSALPDTANYKQFTSAAQKQACGISYINSDTEIYSGKSVNITALSPKKDDVFSELNNYSIVLKITYGNNSFLLMGDAEKEAENALLADRDDIAADLIKIGHHGSKTSSQASFIKKVNPKYAVISCGKDNQNNYPNAKPVEALSSVGANVYVTSECGTVIAASDGNSITVSQHNEINLDGNK